MKTVHIESGIYYDSVFLMRVSSSVEALDGVIRALVAMGTESNLELARSLGFEVPDSVSSDNMIIAIDIQEGFDAANILEQTRSIMSARSSTHDVGYRPRTLQAALTELPEAHLVVVSVAGVHAAREAEAALDRGLHVMIFSDNVPIADEIRLKRRAASEGLLVMGPDCGTAIINGIPLCFANHVRRGPIGVVAASGTGLQEVTSRLHSLGSGVSQAIGTGSRELKIVDAPGLTMRMSLRALEVDPVTEVVIVVSKPPSAGVAEALMNHLARFTKPIILHLVGGVPESLSVPESVTVAQSLAEAADLAILGPDGMIRAGGHDEHAISLLRDARRVQASEGGSRLPAGRVYLRGIYCGGTLADELIVIASKELGPVRSVSGTAWGPALQNPSSSEKHTVLDLGEDIFTAGRPHPMIDPTIRLERIAQEAADPETGVIVLDFVLGTGSHPDPVGITRSVIDSVREDFGQDGPLFIATVVGTEEDPQNRVAAVNTLEAAGVVVADSNAEAAELAVVALSSKIVEDSTVSDERSPGSGQTVLMHRQTTVAANKSGHDVQITQALSKRLFGDSLSIINIGISDFASDMRAAGAQVVDVDWRPPARGNSQMADLLKKLGR